MKTLKNLITLHILALFALLPLWVLAATGDSQSDLATPATADTSVLRVTEKEDQIIAVRTKIRHTTVLVLPPTETILDFVVGDSDYWALNGSANVAYVKPLAKRLETNVTLVCASGRIYAFLVSEDSPPHLVVRVERKEKTESHQISTTCLCRSLTGSRLSARSSASRSPGNCGFTASAGKGRKR